MKTVLAAVALAILAAPASAQLYSLDAANCAIGPGGEGVLRIGSGEFSLTDTDYSRVGGKRDLGNGWFQAVYAMRAEGVEAGREAIAMQITDEAVTLRFVDRDGAPEFRAAACN
ncbi:hypothetical protein [Paracoccus benzoatiresistens]|uniref:Secreted protein n=1 Tax=Paracoccus benzoatiresistens TaxID=2997341 RepID=A0ABT4J1X0_9RHOB|nr:hypothetical protein [Paracoccus sp. EF6]MCZ0961095.1 hypothetical protein [Paracoccus sp. EF6]